MRMGCNVLRRERVGHGCPQANFEVQQAFLADPGQFEVVSFELQDVLNTRPGYVVIGTVLVQARIDLLRWKQPPENVPVRARAEVTNSSEEVKRYGGVRNGEATVCELSQQFVALSKFLRILHASPYVA